MRPQLIAKTLESLFPVCRTVCLEGPPGGGKTTLVRNVAKDLGVRYIEKHMPTMLVEDFGIPFPNGDTLSYKIPDWFPVKGGPLDDGRGGILCFDDRNQASADLQKVLANICQARNLHGVDMADNWMVVSTGNRQSDRAGANRVLSHLRNRETVLEFETHLDDWCAWAVDNDIKPELISFIRFRPGLLHSFDPQRDSNPTPRSWVEGVNDVINVVPAEAEFECFKGAVGEGPAAEFVGFVRIFRKLPNPDMILLNPDKAEVPDDVATLFALTGALAYRATNSNFSKVITYADRMPPDFAVLMVTYAVRRDPALSSTQAFTNWAIKNQNIMF